MNTTILSVTVPIMAIAALGLAVGVPSLRNALRTEELAILPLATGGTVDIREAGKLILSLRGSLGSRDFAKASFLLRDAAGNAAPSSLIALRSVRTRLNGETTLAAKRLTIAAPGRYLLEVAGVEPGSISSNSRIVLSRPGGATLAWRVAWVVVAALALLAGIAFSAVAAFAQSAPAEVFEPAAGSPARTAILNAVRGRLMIPATGESRFKVLHLKIAGPWAYFEGNEIVHVNGAEWQETDLTARALVQQEGGAWKVRALWSLPTNGRHSLQEFQRQVTELRARFRIPAAIFPKNPE